MLGDDEWMAGAMVMYVMVSLGPGGTAREGVLAQPSAPFMSPLQQVLKRRASKTCGPLPPVNPDYSPKPQCITYDPAEARALFKEAGIDPTKLQRTLDTPSGRCPLDKAVSLAVAAQLGRVDIKVKKAYQGQPEQIAAALWGNAAAQYRYSTSRWWSTAWAICSEGARRLRTAQAGSTSTKHVL